MSLIVATFLKEDGVKETQEVTVYWGRRPLTGLQKNLAFQYNKYLQNFFTWQSYTHKDK